LPLTVEEGILTPKQSPQAAKQLAFTFKQSGITAKQSPQTFKQCPQTLGKYAVAAGQWPPATAQCMVTLKHPPGKTKKANKTLVVANKRPALLKKT
jgi:hypothetical protein